MKIISNEKIKDCQKIHERARYLRGRFLNTVSVIEHEISVILTEYFCHEDDDKRELFFTEIVGKLSLNRKTEVLKKIVKSDYPSYWEENNDSLRNLQNIQEFRNKLAHSIVDVSESALSRPLEEGIGFVQWKSGRPISDEDFNDWEVMADMSLSTLRDIKRLLPFKMSAS